jgi:hypothetical protein
MFTVMDDLGPPPATLVDAKGEPHAGAFAGTIPGVKLDGTRVPGLGALDLVRAARRKSWRYVGIFRDDLVLSALVADLGYLGVGFAYVAEGSRVLERVWKAPGGLGFKVGASHETSVALAPRRLVSLASTRTGGLNVSIDVPGISAFVDIEGGVTPLTVVSDLGASLLGVTVKSAGNVARGTVTVEGRTYSLEDARASLDWTEAYFARHTTWAWATGAGEARDGRAVGFNLARGVHDDSRRAFSENALWLDGEPAALPRCTFTVGKGSTPWTIHSEDGAVDLVFEPRGERSEDVTLLLVSSRYRQPFGSFTGRLRDAKGREVRLEGVPGVTEDHEARW